MTGRWRPRATLGPDGVAYAATISGLTGRSGTLIKAGAGLLTLTAENTSSGTSAISGNAILAAFSTGSRNGND